MTSSWDISLLQNCVNERTQMLKRSPQFLRTQARVHHRNAQTQTLDSCGVEPQRTPKEETSARRLSMPLSHQSPRGREALFVLRLHRAPTPKEPCRQSSRDWS